MSGQANSITSIFFALGANFAIFVAKLAAALYTGSGAMLAEAIHSLADSGNQLLLIVGLRGAKRPPNDKHPLGYGKAINRCEKRLKTEFPQIVWSFFEPDMRD
jgi:divalent metal cation (Fe/Co/Zn/Cd) transporter